MKEIQIQVYSQREKLYTECYEALGFHIWSGRGRVTPRL